MLAKQHDAQLILLYVLHPIEYYSSIQFFEVHQPQVSGELIEQAKQEAINGMTQLEKGQ